MRLYSFNFLVSIGALFLLSGCNQMGIPELPAVDRKTGLERQIIDESFNENDISEFFQLFGSSKAIKQLGIKWEHLPPAHKKEIFVFFQSKKWTRFLLNSDFLIETIKSSHTQEFLDHGWDTLSDRDNFELWNFLKVNDWQNLIALLPFLQDQQFWKILNSAQDPSDNSTRFNFLKNTSWIDALNERVSEKDGQSLHSWLYQILKSQFVSKAVVTHKQSTALGQMGLTGIYPWFKNVKLFSIAKSIQALDKPSAGFFTDLSLELDGKETVLSSNLETLFDSTGDFVASSLWQNLSKDNAGGWTCENWKKLKIEHEMDVLGPVSVLAISSIKQALIKVLGPKIFSAENTRGKAALWTAVTVRLLQNISSNLTDFTCESDSRTFLVKAQEFSIEIMTGQKKLAPALEAIIRKAEFNNEITSEIEQSYFVKNMRLLSFKFDEESSIEDSLKKSLNSVLRRISLRDDADTYTHIFQSVVSPNSHFPIRLQNLEGNNIIHTLHRLMLSLPDMMLSELLPKLSIISEALKPAVSLDSPSHIVFKKPNDKAKAIMTTELFNLVIAFEKLHGSDPDGWGFYKIFAQKLGAEQTRNIFELLKALQQLGCFDKKFYSAYDFCHVFYEEHHFELLSKILLEAAKKPEFVTSLESKLFQIFSKDFGITQRILKLYPHLFLEILANPLSHHKTWTGFFTQFEISKFDASLIEIAEFTLQTFQVLSPYFNRGEIALLAEQLSHEATALDLERLSHWMLKIQNPNWQRFSNLLKVSSEQWPLFQKLLMQVHSSYELQLKAPQK